MELLRIHEAADLLRVHPTTMRRWLRAGKLDHVRLPTGERRVPLRALQDLMVPKRTPGGGNGTQ